MLAALDRYPLGCTEQIVSRALPLLYVNELSLDAQLAVDTGIDERIAKAIEIVLARQGSEGAFGLWSPGGDDAWLDAYVTDFLTRARARGFSVSDDQFKLALDRLRNYVSTAPDVATDGGLALSYALYVLARNGMAPVGDLRYIADVKLERSGDADGQGRDRRGARHARRPRAGPRRRSMPRSARCRQNPDFEGGRIDYGSPLRDAAAVVTLAAEGDAPKLILVSGTKSIETARNKVTLHLDAGRMPGSCSRRARSASRISASPSMTAARRARSTAASPRTSSQPSPLTVTNSGDTPLDAVISVSGAPTTPEPAAEHGFTLERSFHTLDGEEADASKAKQNDRFVVLLTVTEPQPQFARVALTDYVPAGFEIDNPRLVSSGDTGTLGWIENAGTPILYRVPRRPLHRGVRAAEGRSDHLHASPISSARCRPEAMCCRRRWSRTCTGPTASAAPRPARWRSLRQMSTADARNPRSPHGEHARALARRRGASQVQAAQRLETRARASSPRSARSGSSRRLPAASSACSRPSGRRRSGAISKSRRVVLDRNGKLLRAYLTSEGRWRLPATREEVDPRFLEALLAYEDKRFFDHRGVDPLALDARRLPTRHAWPHRLGRLDAHHAGRAAARAAAASARSTPRSGRRCARSSSNGR